VLGLQTNEIIEQKRKPVKSNFKLKIA